MCKRSGDVTCLLNTIGYATLKSGWKAVSLKPYSKAEAVQRGSEMRALQLLLEADGEYNIGAQFCVDCTVLARHHNHDDIHCGENVEDLRTMISCPAFSNVLGNIKAAWHCFLRGGTTGHKFDGLFFDPYGQNRSVALARIVSFCLMTERGSGLKRAPPFAGQVAVAMLQG